MYNCSQCGEELSLTELWYDPYTKKRYCKTCFQRINKRKINEPVKITTLQERLASASSDEERKEIIDEVFETKRGRK